MKLVHVSHVHLVMRVAIVVLCFAACSKSPEQTSNISVRSAAPAARNTDMPTGSEGTLVTSTSTSTDDVGEVLQKTLDLRELETFWHLEQKTRGPLHLLFAPPITTRHALQKFGVPVVWVDAAAVRPRELVEITKLDVKSDAARVDFRIRNEGVSGYAAFAKRGAKWELVDKKVAEH